METQIKVPHTEYPKIAKKRKGGKTLKFIGKPYGVTRERIRQILRDHFPKITAEVAGRARKEIRDRKREKETKLCACGCGTVIPKWKKREGHWYPHPYWYPTRQYFPGHQGRNRIPYERTPESRAKSSIARKRGWETGKYKRTPSPETCLKISMATKRNWTLGKYNNKIRRDTIEIRRKLWKILRKHPEGMTIKAIAEVTEISPYTLYYWVKTQRYIKLDIHQGAHQKRGRPPFIIKLTKEPAVNLEDEMSSPYLNLDTGKKND